MMTSWILGLLTLIGYAESAKTTHKTIYQKIFALERNVQSLRTSGWSIVHQIDSVLTDVKGLQSNRNHKCFPCKVIKVSVGNLCDCTEFSPKQDCLAFHKGGFRVNGLYHLNGIGRFNHRTAFCDQTTMGGGWTVFQRRKDGSVNFNKKWNGYKNGFGALTGEFWFGNENIHDLTKLSNAPKKSQLLINMRMKGKYKIVYARYNSFEIGDEQSKYVLRLSGFSGNVRNGMTIHNNMNFTTVDSDNSAKCGSRYGGGWWFNKCFHSFLNGPYKRIVWWEPKKLHPEFVEMKVRRNH